LQLSARAAYGEELRKQIEEKEREKKAKKGMVQNQQNQSSRLVEQGMYSRNRLEFERARISGGMDNSMGAFQYPVTSSAVLPVLVSGTVPTRVEKIWNHSIQPQENSKQHQQTDFRAKNEITAPGE
jgi:RNA:NAD 2'-phosphotransferase (TPT1/KptA family)